MNSARSMSSWMNLSSRGSRNAHRRTQWCVSNSARNRSRSQSDPANTVPCRVSWMIAGDCRASGGIQISEYGVSHPEQPIHSPGVRERLDRHLPGNGAVQRKLALQSIAFHQLAVERVLDEAHERLARRYALYQNRHALIVMSRWRQQ